MFRGFAVLEFGTWNLGFEILHFGAYDYEGFVSPLRH
jgi:hypothetical protein